MLGLSADADRDEIRDAYRAKRDALADVDSDEARAETARLNRAWNVLSDPRQRDRYDAELAEAKASDDWVEPDDGEVADPTPGPADNKRMSYREAREALRRQQAERTLPGAVVAGVTLPPPRKRLMAFAVDFLLLAVLAMGGFYFGQQKSLDEYPAQHRQIDILNAERVRLDYLADGIDADKDKDADARKEADTNYAEELTKLEDLVKRAEDDGDTAKATDYGKALDVARGERERYTSTTKIDDRTDKIDDELKDLTSEVGGPVTTWYFIGVAVGLVATVLPSALTGRTLGKAVFKLRLVRENGTPARFGASFVHYGLPIVFVALGSSILGPFAVAIAVFGVTAFVRNPRQQGWHDRLAHTLVVEG